MHVRAENITDIHCLLLSKITEHGGAQTHFSEIRLDLESRLLLGPKGVVKLTPYEFQVLWLIIRTQKTVIAPAEIYYFLYEDSEDDIPLSNTVEVMVVRIRAKLKKVSDEVLINIDRGFGYRIERMSDCKP